MNTQTFRRAHEARTYAQNEGAIKTNRRQRRNAARIVAIASALSGAMAEVTTESGTVKLYARPYVGIAEGKREWFRATNPTKETHPQFNAVIGPFKTVKGAQYMVANPGCESVSQAEKLAKG